MGEKLSEHLLPQTRAYTEIWWDQEKVATTDEEPILGKPTCRVSLKPRW